jgi:hypothetical protein
MSKRHKPLALVIGNDHYIQELFRHRGFDVMFESNTTKMPKIVVFTGGEDVDPSWYGQPKHFKTTCHSRRDHKEMVFFEKYLDVPKVGICRGGQFLNVLSGGSMWQDVDGHALHPGKSHKVIDLLFTKNSLEVPSSHHQMMLPSDQGYVLAIANEAKHFLSMAKEKPPKPKYDPEVVWYPKSLSMCYQSHPEYKLKSGDTAHVDYFFDLIDWAFDLPK